MLARSTNKSITAPSTPHLRFPQKLWKIANECQSGAVTWSPHGKSILLRYSLFKEEFMNMKSEFFKTDNISSFVRQLNLYGFRKIYDHTNKQGYKASSDLHEFANMYFQREKPDLLENVTRKGVLKEKNEIDLENHCFLNFNTDASFETKNNEENTLEESTSENQPQLSEDKENQPQLPEDKENQPQLPEDKENQPIATTTRRKYRRNKERHSNKQPKEECKQKRKYTRAPKLEKVTPPLFQLSKYPLEPYKEQLATLKHPDLYPNLIFYQDEDDYPFLRNTSRDVMWSSTLPFQESMEYQELKETYARLQSDQQIYTRPQLGLPLPLNALYNKVSLIEKTHPRI